MRKSIHYIKEKRDNKKNVIFMTGITSFLGSFIALELLNKGHHINFLCRPDKGITAHQRVVKVLKWLDFNSFERIEVIEGNIEKPNFGLSDNGYNYLKKNIDEIIHCVADTSFKKEDKDRVERINKQGTLNLLSLAKHSDCYFFHHISTAYVAGIKEGVCQEEFEQQSNFHNYYEQTKYDAEHYVKEICDENGIRFKIFRPSIVCGDSKTGRCLKFNALYYPVKGLYYFKKQFEQDFNKNNGVNAEKMGVKKLYNNKMYIPIRFKNTSTAMNFVTIDYVVNSILAIMDNCFKNDIHHITNNNPKSIDELIEYVNKYLNVEGIVPVDADKYEEQSKNTLERLFDGYIKPYDPYMHDKRYFDSTKTVEILKNNNIEAPDINYETFARCIDYAIENNWGKTILNSVN